MMQKINWKNAEDILFIIPPNKTTIVRDYYCTFSSKAFYNWPSQDLVILSSFFGYNYHLLDCSKMTVQQSYLLLKTYLNEKRITGENIILLFSTGSTVISDDYAFCEYLRNKKFEGTIAASGFFLNFLKDDDFKRLPSIDVFIKDILYPFQNENYCGNLILNKENNFRLQNVPKHELFMRHGLYWHPLVRTTPFSLLITSLGCTHHCSFCSLGSSFPYMIRAIDDIEREIEFIARLKIKSVLIPDPNFFVNKDRALDIASRLKKREIYWTAQARPDSLIERGFAKEINRLGCFALMMGVESLDSDTLKGYGKSISLEDIYEAFSLCSKYGIHTLAYFIINPEKETEEITKKNIEKLRKLKADLASFGFLSFDHGSRLREQRSIEGTDSIVTADSSLHPEIMDPYALKLRNIYYKAFYFRVKQMARASLIFLESDSKLMFIRCVFGFFVNLFRRTS